MNENVPSRELTYPTLGSSENHLQIYFGWGYVRFLEGISPQKNWRLSKVAIAMFVLKRGPPGHWPQSHP